MRLDAHIHIDTVFPSRLGKEITIDRKDLNIYIDKEEITHICSYYASSIEMKSLIKERKDITFYPAKWVKTLREKLDSFQIGIKIHSLRGGIFNQGIDYRGKELKEYLKTLPDGLIVFCHTQGVSLGVDRNDVESVALLALSFPKLKFVLNHSGCFGFKSMYPSDFQKTEFFKLALKGDLNVRSSILLSEKIDNLWCESSILLGKKHFKSPLLAKHDKLLLGSDYPFSISFPASGSVIRQEKIIKAICPERDTDLIHKKAIEWIEK